MLLFMVVVGCPSFVMSCLGKCYEGNNDPVLTHEWGYTVTNQKTQCSMDYDVSKFQYVRRIRN
jgi:hypothetical protein